MYVWKQKNPFLGGQARVWAICMYDYILSYNLYRSLAQHNASQKRANLRWSGKPRERWRSIVHRGCSAWPTEWNANKRAESRPWLPKASPSSAPENTEPNWSVANALGNLPYWYEHGNWSYWQLPYERDAFSLTFQSCFSTLLIRRS